MTWALGACAALLIGYATVSRRLERLNVSGAMFFTTAGLVVGPGLGLLDLGLPRAQQSARRPRPAAAGAAERLGRDVLHHRRSGRRSGARVAGPGTAWRTGEAARRDHVD